MVEVMSSVLSGGVVEVDDVADVLRDDGIGGIELEGFGEARVDDIVLAEDACLFRLLDEIGDEVGFRDHDGVLVVRSWWGRARRLC